MSSTHWIWVLCEVDWGLPEYVLRVYLIAGLIDSGPVLSGLSYPCTHIYIPIYLVVAYLCYQVLADPCVDHAAD
jgi:hypothetical protein